MTHEPRVVETKELNNEQVSYRVVCCGEACNPSRCRPDSHVCEDSWHTMAVLPTTDDSRSHEVQLATIFADTAARHEAKVLWRAKQAASVTLPK